MAKHAALIVVLILAGILSSCSNAPTTTTNPATNPALGPNSPDEDGDGIPDMVESNGMDYTDPIDAATKHLDLAARAASPRHKDIVVWVAWMQSAQHSHKPIANSITIVENAFKTSPISNPDGYPGIRLIVIVAERPISEVPILGSLRGDEYDWSQFDQVKKANFPKELANIAQFVIFAHSFDAEGHSGIARAIPGRDFLVSLGGFTNGVGTTQEQAGTFMHELGHTLGLRHGGVDHANYKPNYISVMNYLFQLNGTIINGVPAYFDYSRFSLAAQETALDERIGLSNDLNLVKYGTQFFCASSALRFVPSIARSATDWNCDSRFGGQVSTDVNGDRQTTMLAGADDWSRLILKPGSPTTGISATEVITGMRPGDELTAKVADKIPLPPVSDVHARREGNGVVVNWNRMNLDRVLAYQIYRVSPNGEDRVLGVTDNTEAPSFVDPAAAGPGGYRISAIYAPHSQDTQSTPPREEISGAIRGSAAIERIRKEAPLGTSVFERLGRTAGVTRESAVVPKMLLETAKSTVARVE